MDVNTLPPIPDPAAGRADGGATAAPARGGSALAPAPGAVAANAVAANAVAVNTVAVNTVAVNTVAALAADPVHIHPLKPAGAMQILIAEVRAELLLPGVAVAGAATGAAPVEPAVATAPQTLVHLFLQALPAPEALAPADWLLAATQVEAAVSLGLDKAVETVSGWHDVPAPVVEGALITRAVVVSAMREEPPNPLWLRPEWLGLAPRMERYWRRRRRARRALSDPDPHWHERDAEPEGRPPAEEPTNTMRIE